MRFRSIRLRLLFLALIGTVLALAIAGAGLVALFGRHAERRIGQELDIHIAQIAGNLRIAGDGSLTVEREPGDPRFSRVFGGLYWQVRDEATGASLRSVSLWDAELVVQDDPLPPGVTQVRGAEAPDGQPVIVHEKRVILTGNGAARPVRISVAVNRAETEALKYGFARDLFPGLAFLGAVLLAGAWFQVGAGLRPFAAVGRRLGDIRSGRVRRLTSEAPVEIAPLIEEINSLLDAQDNAINRARDRSADLAHGLKTPLTALIADTARLRARHETAIAADIEAVATQMRRTIERELARSRIRNAGPASKPVSVKAAAVAIARTLARTPHGERVSFTVDLLADARVAIDADDLNEIMGNLMENAARNARSAVRAAATRSGAVVAIEVSDDGPSVGPDDIGRLSERGRRLDEAGAGSGLGLAIVSDILAGYGSEPEFFTSDLGGLGVRFSLPAG